MPRSCSGRRRVLSKTLSVVSSWPDWQLLTSAQCNQIHKSIVEQFRIAIVYGKSVKHQPQRVGLTHELADEDISKPCE